MIATIVCAVVLVGGSGAGTTKAPGAVQIDVSTRSAVVNYLRSIHVNPKGIVIQRGARNYAGPNCPGKRWTCTDARRVVQIATGHGKNRFRCTAARCVVVQLTKSPLAASTGKCVKTTGVSQACSITQTGTGPNTAIVYMDATKLSGLTQNTTQTAQIVQTANAALNKACVFQNTKIDGSTTAKKGVPVTVSLDAHQSISIDQNSHSGGNNVQNANSSGGGSCAGGALNQSQTITSKATGSGSITQNENAANGGANLMLDIKQNQASGFFGSATGANDARFEQTNTLTAVANTPTGFVNQTQSSANGGLLATINQDSRGVSTAIATQTETQCEDAHLSGPLDCHTNSADPPGYSLTQTQVGPVRKGAGDSLQTGNAGNVFTVTQTSTQDNDTGSNQTNLIHGDCVTDGNCTVTQTTDINGTPHTNTASGQDVDTQTTCSGDDCTSTEPPPTPTFTWSGSQLTAQNVDTQTFGVGGMRNGDGSGSIVVSGLGGPVAKAYLYWNGPTNSTDSTVNANVTFADTAVTGTNIGIDADNNWGFVNSQSYRADVTSLVTGNATYSLANFVKADANINGVALVVFTTGDRNVVLWNGNDSNCTFGPGGTGSSWDETISGVPYPGSGSASLDFVVADGQTADDGTLAVNGTTIASGAIFNGATGPSSGATSNSLWDVQSLDISVLDTGPNDLHLTDSGNTDCLSLVVAAASVPVGPVITAPTLRAPARTATIAPLSLATSGRGGVVR